MPPSVALLVAAALLCAASVVSADDTAWLQDLISNCTQTGGVALLPHGTFVVAMPEHPLAETIALAIPNDCVVQGRGINATVLKWAASINENNWWRMLGAAASPAWNLTIRDLTIDGSTNWTRYDECRGDSGYCEHNAGIFFYAPRAADGEPLRTIRNVLVRNVWVHSIGGDAVDFGHGVQSALVEDVIVSDYLRQGVDFGGNNASRDSVVRNVTEAVWLTVTQPGGSTVHVEEATGLRNLTIEGCRVDHGIAASSARDLRIVNNFVRGAIVANVDGNVTVADNWILCGDRGSCISLLAPQHATVARNNLLVAGDNSGAAGVYIWGERRHYGLAHNVMIDGNQFLGTFTPLFRGHPLRNGAIILDGVVNVTITSSNAFANHTSAESNTCVCCRYHQPADCKDVSFNVT